LKDSIDRSLERLTNLSVSDLGRKACAMEYFRLNHLFPNSLIIIPPGKTNEVAREAAKFPIQENGYTVRYSNKNNIGLPRLFLKTRAELFNKINETHNQEWATIIHPFFRVQHSFELNISKKSLILEHVPGMWESDNTNQPDSITITNKKTDIYITKNYRTTKTYTASGEVKKEFEPTSKHTALTWAKRVIKTAEIIQRDFPRDHPTNIHFIETESKEWVFLNIRSGHTPTRIETTPPRLQPLKIREISDLENWDKISPLLISISINRGSEKNIIPAFSKIKNHTTTLYIDFGALSHPAIILRELGFKLIPSYKIDNNTESFEHFSINTETLRNTYDN